MIPSSKRMWLGSSILAGLILASSLPALATTQNQTQAATIHSLMKPMLVITSNVPTGTYTEAVHKQLKWVSSPVILPMGTNTLSKQSVPSQSNPTVVVASTKSTSKPVQVAAAASKQQVSRSNSSDLADHALSLVGVPYVFGGASRSGFDCSGYTQYVFKGSGTYLPRTASEQFNVGSSVKRDQLQSGDLVFFTTYAPGASHVGIYIGGGRFVHASNSGVQVTSLSESYYASRYIGARRAN
ncbi:C40 family peptidase [Desulfosporosinus metallidurans]|uniref:C40 family peptidase n=1 Tax=Desulfosporosinus metallidurans TaxID=1888891 RepID=UPI001F40EC4D|nr:C40 family peptidase [Desulfosporosinus metallidurans]